MEPPIHVVGGGLAGSECAFQLAERGVAVVLHEMRPGVGTPAHQTGRFAELVCSNSFRSDDPLHAAGLLKREMEALGSLIIAEARRAAVPAGGALAMDRDRFAAAVTARLAAHPQDRGAPPRGPGDPRRRRGDRHRSADLGGDVARLGRSPGQRLPLFLRRHRPHRRGREPRPEQALLAVALRQGRRRRLSQQPARRGSVRRLPRRPGGRRGAPAPRLRARDVLRGVPADRGAGPPRPRHPALRADEAGGADHSRRPPAVGGGPAPPGEPGQEPVQPGGLPVAAAVARAAAGLPHAPRPGARRVRPPGADPPQHLRQRPHPPRPPLPGEGRPPGAPRRSDHRCGGLLSSRPPPASPSPSTSRSSAARRPAATIPSPSPRPPPSAPSPAI